MSAGNEKEPPGREAEGQRSDSGAGGGIHGALALGARRMLQQAIIDHGQRFYGQAPLAFILSPGTVRGIVGEMLDDPLARAEVAELVESMLGDGPVRLFGVLLFIHSGVEGVSMVEFDGSIREV